MIVVVMLAFWADGRFVLRLLNAENGLPSAAGSRWPAS